MTFDPNWLIYVAAALLLAAYALRDELRLRLMIVVSSFVYIAYYYFIDAGPLWEGIITSVLMLGVNFWVIGQVVLERTTLRMSEDEKRLFEAFDTLSPGQFRRIAGLAKWRVAAEPDGAELTLENEPCETLYFVFEGSVRVSKQGHQFDLPAGNFIGEVAYVLKRKPTAATLAPANTRYVEWRWDDLRELSDKHPLVGNALNALLTRDLAQKIVGSYQADDHAAQTA